MEPTTLYEVTGKLAAINNKLIRAFKQTKLDLLCRIPTIVNYCLHQFPNYLIKRDTRTRDLDKRSRQDTDLQYAYLGPR